MKCKQLIALGALLALAVTLLPAMHVNATDQAVTARQQIGVNLLENSGFEGKGVANDNTKPNYGNWTRDTFTGAVYGEIFTPEGWLAWWEEGDYGRPECKVIPNEYPFNTDPTRIYEGHYSWQCFTFFRRQNDGLVQVVRNLQPNSVVEGSFYAHSWSCGDDEPPLSCGDANGFYFRVGIDPNGGTNPFSADIVWSAPYYNRDRFSIVGPVQATVGAGGVASIFLQANGKWALKHNDSYFDKADFHVVSQGTPVTATPPPPPPTTEGATPMPTTPAAPPTPLPDGTVVHVVVEGDTLFGIAINYNVDLDELRRLNAATLGPNDMLSIGQEIVVKGTGGAPAPTPTPTLSQTPTAPEATPQMTATVPATTSIPAAPTQGLASLCVLAYEDGNKDMLRQSADGEMPLPNAEITLVGTAGVIGTPYRTDGIREPYCFENLQPGSYILRHTAPSGYSTDVGPWNIPLAANQIVNVELGYVRSGSSPNVQPTVEEGAPKTPQANPTEAPEQNNPEETKEEKEPSSMTNILSTVLRVSGVVVAILAVAVLALFFLSRRSL